MTLLALAVLTLSEVSAAPTRPPVLVVAPEPGNASWWYRPGYGVVKGDDHDLAWLSRVPAPLLPDELERLHQVLAKEARRVKGTRVLGAGPLKAAQALAAEGRRTADGPMCAAPPNLVDVLASRYPDLLVARTHAHCEGSGNRCALTQDVRRVSGEAPAGATPVYRKVDLGWILPGKVTNPKAWLRAARRLRTVRIGDIPGGVIGGMGSSGPPTFRELARFGAWNQSTGEADGTLTRRAPPLYACGKAAGLASSVTVDMTVRWDADGQVDAVWSRLQRPELEPEVHVALVECLERTWREVQLPTMKTATRRAFARLHIDERGGTSVWVSRTKGKVEGLRPSRGLERPGMRARLGACVPQPAEGERVVTWQVRTKLEIDPSGAVTDVSLDGLEGTVQKNAEPCLVAALKHAAWPCTADGQPARLETTLNVRRYD